MRKQAIKRSYTDLYQPIRTLLFKLPVEERLELMREVEDRDWKEEFSDVMSQLSKKAKASGYTSKDVSRLIEDARKAR